MMGRKDPDHLVLGLERREHAAQQEVPEHDVVIDEDGELRHAAQPFTPRP
jgi:hypothetical protein